jgi:hypothetical protein
MQWHVPDVIGPSPVIFRGLPQLHETSAEADNFLPLTSASDSLFLTSIFIVVLVVFQGRI